MLVITKLGIGGAESQVRDLAMAYRRRGLEVTVVSLRRPEAHVEKLASEGVEVHCLGMESPLALASAFARLLNLYRTYRPTVVHSHCYHANILCRISKLLAPRMSVVSTAHSTYEISRKRGSSSQAIRDKMYRWTDRLSAYNTQVSRIGLDRYLNERLFRKVNAEWVPNGIDLPNVASKTERAEGRRRMGWHDDAFVWLHAGRLSQAKNQPLLIEAFGKVLQQHPKALLAVAGGGEMEEMLQELVAKSGNEASIQLLGPRNDVPELMQYADGFVLSSDWEGMPIVLLEAGAAGLPCVSTDVGSVAEAVGETGFLVPAGDSGQLAEAMLKMMQLEPEERKKLGDAFRVRTESQFSLNKIADIWIRIYASAKNKGASKRP